MPFGYRFPPAHEEILSNGLRLMLVPHHEQEGVEIVLQVPVGRFADTRGKEGCAEMTVELMQRGTRECSAEAFSEAMEHVGSGLFAEVGDEYTVIGARMLARFMDRVLGLFWNAVTSPRLDPEELRRLSREHVTTLQAARSDPASLARRHFHAELCGPDHPMGRPRTQRSINSVTINDIRDFYTRHFHPRAATLLIVGDFDLQRVRQSWEERFAGWRPEGGKQPQSPLPLPNTTNSRVRLVNKPGLTQATIMLGHPVPGELDEDRLALSLANYILGGGNFSSRLTARVRAEQGKTYGIGSQISFGTTAGVFSIGTTTQSGQTLDVLRSVLEEYRKFGCEGPGEEELAKAREYAKGNLAIQLEGIGNIAEKLLWLRFFGRDNSHVELFDERVSCLDRGDVAEAVARHLSSPAFAIVVVGGKSAVFPGLERFGEVKTVGFRSDP